MHLRTLLLAACLAVPMAAPFATIPAAAFAAQPAAMTVGDLMHVTAFDLVFTEFGTSIAASPEHEGIPFNATMLAAWQEAAHEAFVAKEMHAALADALADMFTAEEMTALSGFYRTEFGHRITDIERAVAGLDANSQLAARERGLALLDDHPAGTRRYAQINEMLSLVSAEVANAMVGESIRGMLIGMSVAGQRGDIQVPWDDIDQHLTQLMPRMQAEIDATQQALMLFAYQKLSEADLDRYLEFLRTAPAQKFYAATAYAVSRIVSERMSRFGTALVDRMNRVNV